MLAGTIKTASPTDVIFHFTAECIIEERVTTTLVTVGTDEDTDESETLASAIVWVEVDGKSVAVSKSAADDGTVRFCDRRLVHERTRETFFPDPEDAGTTITDTITETLEGATTGAFNWVQLDLGSSPKPHRIEVKARLEAVATSPGGRAHLVIGRRTLIAVPAKLANDATF